MDAVMILRKFHCQSSYATFLFSFYGLYRSIPYDSLLIYWLKKFTIQILFLCKKMLIKLSSSYVKWRRYIYMYTPLIYGSVDLIPYIKRPFYSTPFIFPFRIIFQTVSTCNDRRYGHFATFYHGNSKLIVRV